MILLQIETLNTKYNYEIEDRKLTCIKLNHNKPVQKVIIDESVPISDRFLCEKCLLSNALSANTIGYRLFDDVMQNLRFQNLVDLFIYLQENQVRLINFEKESKQIFEQVFVQKEKLQNDQQPQYCMVKFKKQQMLNQSDQKDEKYNISKVQQVTRTQLKHRCQALAFIHQNTILIAAEGDCVKMWKLFGPIKYLRKLNGPQGLFGGYITSFVLNNSANWIALCGTSYLIRCWKYHYNGVLSSIQSSKNHNASIIYLMLNKKEDELITIDSFCFIIIWKVNCIRNKIKFQYTLDGASINDINGSVHLSLNQSGTYLIGSFKRVIILWTKGQKNIWEYQNKFSLDHCVLYTQFIDDSSFICSIKDSLFYKLLEITDGLILRRKNIFFYQG